MLWNSTADSYMLTPLSILLAERLSSTFSPMDYGAIGDGTSDDAIPLQTAATAAYIASATGPAILLIDRAYATSATVLARVNDGMEIRFVSTGQINVIGSTNSVRGFYVFGGGVSGSPTTITANANYGTRAITVADATGFAAGDYVLIEVMLGYVAQPSYGRGMTSQIHTVVGNVITLIQPVGWNIDATQTNTVTRFLAAKHVKITGVKVDGANYTGTGGIGFLCQYLADSYLTNCFTKNFNQLNGSGIYIDRMWACTMRDILTTVCGDTQSNAITLWYASNCRIENLRSYKSSGFGVDINYTTGNTISDLVSEYSVGRGVKLYGSCDNMIDRIRGNYAQGTLVGVGFTVGSANNRVTHVEALYNGTSGLWFNGLGNSNNTIHDVKAFGNIAHDIWISATAPFTDNFNVITGIDPLAINVLNDGANTGNVIQYLLNAGTTNFMRSDGTQTNTLTDVMIATNFNANGTTNAPGYLHANVADFGGTAGGRAYIGDNIYWDEIADTYRTNITNASVGYSLLELGLNGAITHAAFSGATTAGASVTPTKVAVVKQGDTFTSLASIKAYSGTAIPAGGTAGSGLLVSSATNFGVFFGSGAPSLSAAKGSLYLRSDGSTTNDRMYVNTNGSTTWTAVTTVA
jgi:hypothetical protein